MKLFTFNATDIPPENRQSELEQLIPSNVSYVQFGDEVLLFGSDPGNQERRAGFNKINNLKLREQFPTVKRENLYLVVQIGSCFQQENPDVPVIFNKGRYIVVNLTAKQFDKFAESKCYTVRPLEANQVIFETRKPSAKRSEITPWIKDLVDKVSQSNVESNLAYLVSFKTRHSTSSHYIQAAKWAEEKLRAMGYITRQEPVSVETGKSWNVIAEKEGNGSNKRGLVLAVAHLDSINITGGSAAKAPGADDNGSGCAGVLEIARVLQNHHGENDLRLILFGGEEQGLYGSTQYLEGLTDKEQKRILAVINMDMIGTRNTSSPTVLIEGAFISQAVIDGLAEAAAKYTKLTVQTSLNPYNSDHVPFINAGIPAVLTIEGTDSANHNVHTANDTLNHINYDLMLDILRMNIAFIATTVNKTGGTSMAETKPKSNNEIQLTIKSGENLLEALKNLPFQYSGCYKYNGGASSGKGRGFIDRNSGQSIAALRNPIYKLEEPVYIESAEDYSLSDNSEEQLRLTLNIDIDGSDPLNVVSGAVALGTSSPETPFPHFIGRVTSNSASVGGRNLVVEDFRFRWVETNNNIDRLTIELNGSALIKPAARVIFHDTVRGDQFGPFLLQQESMYFREVEVDVDREKNAIDVEPVSTHIHPDRPIDVTEEELTLESAFAKAGIRITRSGGSDTIVDTTEAGADKRWNYSELHDSMRLHWREFANKPQWKMWIFLAELADSDTLGGVMFDGEIDEPGGVDRQGTAIFTRCPYFHTVEGDYIKANPPEKEAVKRELFFNLIHETGHAFNLAHSFQKELEGGWSPPSWMPLKTNSQSLSWMNYPDSATPGGGAGANATWFYKRFRFRFDEGELLFMRHAPETYVQMGAAGWFDNHGRVARISLEHRLKLTVRSLKQFYELGEPILIELKLGNESKQPITVHRNLDPSDGLVEISITNPRGERRPFLPVDHTRTIMSPHILEPGGIALYQSVDVTMGSFGFHFKEPGAYRIEASYTNIDGGAAASVMQIYVRPPENYDVVPIVNELFDARLGTALYVEGTRVMDEVNNKFDWIRNKLDKEIGEQNPVSRHLTAVRFKPLATQSKVIEPTLDSTMKIKVFQDEPDRFVEELSQMLTEKASRTADTMGHIWYCEMVNAYTEAAVKTGERGKAEQAQEQMVGLFKERNVVTSVVEDAEERLNELSGKASRGKNQTGGGRKTSSKGGGKSDN
jgi:hypothetical protein